MVKFFFFFLIFFGLSFGTCPLKMPDTGNPVDCSLDDIFTGLPLGVGFVSCEDISGPAYQMNCTITNGAGSGGVYPYTGLSGGTGTCIDAGHCENLGGSSASLSSSSLSSSSSSLSSSSSSLSLSSSSVFSSSANFSSVFQSSSVCYDPSGTIHPSVSCKLSEEDIWRDFCFLEDYKDGRCQGAVQHRAIGEVGYDCIGLLPPCGTILSSSSMGGSSSASSASEEEDENDTSDAQLGIQHKHTRLLGEIKGSIQGDSLTLIGILDSFELHRGLLDSISDEITDEIDDINWRLGNLNDLAVRRDEVLHNHMGYQDGLLRDIEIDLSIIQTPINNIQNVVYRLENDNRAQTDVILDSMAGLSAQIAAQIENLSYGSGGSSNSGNFDCAGNFYFPRICSDPNTFDGVDEYNGCCNSGGSGGSGGSSGGTGSSNSDGVDCDEVPDDVLCVTLAETKKGNSILDDILSLFDSDDENSESSINAKIDNIINESGSSSGSGSGASSDAVLVDHLLSLAHNAKSSPSAKFIDETFNEGWNLPSGSPKWEFTALGHSYVIDPDQFQVGGKNVFEWIGIVFLAASVIAAMLLIFGS